MITNLHLSKILRLTLMCLAFALPVGDAVCQIDLRNLRYVREFSLADFDFLKQNGQTLKYKFRLRNDQDNRNTLTSFGHGWCPILRDQGPSLLPLQHVYEVHNSKEFEMMWGECSGAFKAKTIFTLLGDTNPNKKSLEDIYSGQFDEKEKFLFIEKSSSDNSKRVTLEISKKGAIIWYPAYMAYFSFDTNNRIKSIESTETKYDMERSEDGKTIRITHTDSFRNSAKELIEKNTKLLVSRIFQAG